MSYLQYITLQKRHHSPYPFSYSGYSTENLLPFLPHPLLWAKEGQGGCFLSFLFLFFLGGCFLLQYPGILLQYRGFALQYPRFLQQHPGGSSVRFQGQADSFTAFLTVVAGKCQFLSVRPVISQIRSIRIQYVILLLSYRQVLTSGISGINSQRNDC